MYVLLDRALKFVIKQGALQVTDPAGKTHTYGDGKGPPVAFTISTPAAAGRIAADADRFIGECYMDGTLEINQGSVFDMLALLINNAETQSLPKAARALYSLRKISKRIDQYNPVGKAKQNVAHHYDLSGQLYDLFLDRDRQYSCAYFETDDGSLEDAQLAKKRHLAAKLNIKPGMKVLDIGSGWGGLGLYLAEICGAEVDRCHPFGGTAQAVERARRPAWHFRSRPLRTPRLPPPRPEVRPHRFGGHVRACGHWPLQGVLRQGPASAG